jgi:hypothetical protein
MMKRWRTSKSTFDSSEQLFIEIWLQSNARFLNSSIIIKQFRIAFHRQSKSLILMFCQMQFFVIWNELIFWCMQIEIFSWISKRKRWRSFENKNAKSSELLFTFIKRSRMRKCEFAKRKHYIISKRWFKKISCSLFLMMLIRNSKLQKNDLINYINARSSNIFFSFHFKTTTFIIILFIIHFFQFFHLFYSSYSSSFI